MNIFKFIKLLVQKIKYIIILPLVIGGIVFFLTRNLPVSYAAETTIFTGITSNVGLQVMETRIDNVATQNEYNNVLAILNSDMLFEEVGLKLLTQHLMLDKPNKVIISEANYKELMINVPDKVKKLIVKDNFEKSYANLSAFIEQDENNYIYRLINYGSPYYSIKSISTLKSERVNNSDMLKLTYISDDAGISFNTLKFASEIFIKRYSGLKNKQFSSAVLYYENKLLEMSKKLDDAENRLLKFNVDNVIINYYEQTEQVTTQQEKIEIKLQEVKMEFEAAEAVLIKLEKEVEIRFNINLRNKEILAIRKQLVDYNLLISRAETDDDSNNKLKTKELKIKRNLIEKKLDSKIDSIYLYENKSQGIESQKILGEWLDAVKSFESYSALYKSMKERQINFMSEFQKYAPLGATIKRIEREINIYEQEYLTVLQNLNLARQNQHETDKVSNMKVMDPPQFPINAIPSKKKIYVLIAALFSVIFYVLGLLIIELLDSRIKTPSGLKKLSGLDVIGAFCIHSNKKFINTEKITEKAALFIFEKIKILSKDKKKPFVIQILSNWDGVGKTFIAEIIKNEIDKHGFTTSCLCRGLLKSDNDHSSYDKKMNENSDTNFINLFSKYDSYVDLATKENIHTDFMICTMSAISNGFDNSVIINSADMNIVVFDANTTWIEADNFNLDKVKQIIPDNLFAVLTEAAPDNVEEIYGETPKKRSFIRVWAKKILKRFIK